MIATAPNSHDATLSAYALTTIHHKARRLVGRFGYTADDLPDLEQELALDLLRRAPAYDPTKAQWSTFLSRCIDHRITDLIRARCSSKRDPERVSPLDDDDSAGSGAHLRYRADASPLLDLRLDLTAAIAELPAGLRHICARLMTSSVSAIAAEDGRSRWHVYQDLARIRAAFLAAGLNTYC